MNKLKADLTVPKAPLIYPAETHKLDGNDLSRREFIRSGSKAATGIMIAPLVLSTKKVAANPLPLPWLAWAGRRAFAAGIDWLVNQLLDRAFPDFGNDQKVAEELANELDVQRIVNPKPTDDGFHNKYASPYAIMNRSYYFDAKYSKRFGYYVELNLYLRSDKEVPLLDSRDLSTPEIKLIARFHEASEYKKILYPCGQRQRPVYDHYVDYKIICDQQEVNPNSFELEYVRPFGDGSDSYTACSVKQKKIGDTFLVIL